MRAGVVTRDRCLLTAVNVEAFFASRAKRRCTGHTYAPTDGAIVRRMRIAIAALTALVAAPAVVSAQPAPAKSPNPFVISDRPWDRSSGGVDTAFVLDLGDTDTDITVLRFDGHIEHMISPTTGILASLPIHVAFGDFDTVTAIGALDAGAFFVNPMGPRTKLILRGSATLPTAGNDFDEVITNLFGSFSRINSIAQIFPELIIGRGSASIIHRGPTMTLRLDGGLDIPLIETGDFEIEDRTPIVHFGGGLALGAGPNKFIAEIANVRIDNNGGDDTYLHQFLGGFSMNKGAGTIFIGASTVVDSIFEDDDGFDAALHFSYRSTYGR